MKYYTRFQCIEYFFMILDYIIFVIFEVILIIVVILIQHFIYKFLKSHEIILDSNVGYFFMVLDYIIFVIFHVTLIIVVILIQYFIYKFLKNKIVKLFHCKIFLYGIGLYYICDLMDMK